MGSSGTNIVRIAAIFTLIEAVVWSIFATFGLLLYYCQLSVQWNDLTLHYFYNPKHCSSWPYFNSGLSEKTEYILIYYCAISLLWVLSSLVMLGGACGKLKGATFYPWFITAILSLISDIAVMIVFTLDFTKDTLYDTTDSTIVMVVASVRGGLLWFFNIVILWFTRKAFIIQRDAHHSSKTVAPGPVLTHQSNWTFVTDNIRPSAKDRLNGWSNPPDHIISDYRMYPHQPNTAPMANPFIEELKERNSAALINGIQRNDSFRDGPSTASYSDQPKWNGRAAPGITEISGKMGVMRDAFYGISSYQIGNPNYSPDVHQSSRPTRRQMSYDRDAADWNNPRNSNTSQYGNGYRDLCRGTKHTNYPAKPLRNGYDSIGMKNGDQGKKNPPPNRDTRDRTSDRRDNLYSDGPYASPGVSDRRTESYDNGNRKITPQRSNDYRDRLRRTDSNQSDDSSVRSDEVKRTSTTVPPKGLHNQYPWSYVLPQINSAVALRKKQLQAIADDQEEEYDEDLPPVPVPDYTLHFNRLPERPGLSSAARY